MKFLLYFCLFLSSCWESVLASPQFVWTCAQNDKIEADERTVIEESALSFVHTALEKDPADAYSIFTENARKNISAEQFTQMLRQAILPLGPFKDLRIASTYLATIRGIAPPTVVCAEDLSRPQGWVSFAVNAAGKQAHVLIEGHALNNIWTFVFWLIPQGGGWKVEYFFANVSTLGEKTAADIWFMARQEKDHGHFFNSVVLYAVTSQLAYRGPNFQLGIVQSISEEIQNLTIPEQLQAPPPFLWKTATESFRVLNVSPTAIGGKIYLVINQETKPWKEDAQVEKWNQELLSFFLSRFPECRDVFAGIVVRGNERGGNRGWGTVMEFDTGKP